MSTTIESLELEIISSSKSAESGIDALTASLEKLKNATKDGLGLDAVAEQIQNVGDATNKAKGSIDKSALSTVNLYAKLKMAATMIKSVGKKIGKAIEESNDYTENLNLFGVAMGQYADGAKRYAENVEELMGIDPSEWMRNQGIFMTLGTGFGVASDKAAEMSQNLTQLGYDLSSFFNISTEDAMLKLQSGLSGELEPLRRLGYDLSQAKLEATAAALGIDKAVSSMTQAEKAQLRYYAIMTQVTEVHGDMSRTLENPANQLRVFKAQVTQAARAIGNIFIPMLNAILPYAIAVAKVIRIVANEIASLFGFEIPDLDDVTQAAASNTDALSQNLEESQKEAKKLKSYMLGFDELNVLNTNEDESTSDILSQFDFELPTYDFIGALAESRVSQIVKDMKEWLGITEDIDSWSELLNTRLGTILKVVGEIALGLLLWKLEKGFIDGISMMKTLLSTPSYAITIGATIAIVGFTIAFDGMEDAIKNGLDGMNFGETLVGSLLSVGGSAVLGASLAKWIAKTFKGTKVAKALTTAAKNLGLGTGKAAASSAGAALAAGIAGIVVGVPMYLTGLLDALKEGLDWLNATLIGAGATLAGAGIGTIIGSLGGPIGAGIGALIGLAVGLITDGIILIVQNWESISAWFERTFTAIGQFFVDLWDGIVEVWNVVAEWFNTHVITPVADFFSTMWTNIKNWSIAAWDGIKSVFTTVGEWFNTYVITPVANFFSGLWDGIVNLAKGCWDGIVSVFSPVVEWFGKLFGSVAQTISDIFYNIGVIAKGCWEVIKAVWGIVAEWFNTKVITPVANFFSTMWANIKALASSTWDGIKTVFTVVGNWFNTYVITPVGNFFSTMWTNIKKWAVSAWDGIKDAFTNIGSWMNINVITPLGNFFSGMWDGFLNGAKQAWEGVKSVFNTVATFFKNTFTNAWQGVVKVFSVAGDIFVDIKNGIVDAFKTIVNGLIKGINKVIAAPFNGINTVLNKIKNVKIVGITPFSDIKTISVPEIPLLAGGGIVNSGQMFIAREAGAELVGNIGGRTGVMNNDQIVESVSTGVYQAVVAALGSGSGDEGNTQIVINLDGEKIYENQQKVARNRGYNLGMGAFSFG